MAELEIIGAPQSNFVRVARMACAEKGVPYKLTAVFPHTPEVNAVHPLGKIPAMRHGDLTLAETSAMCRYIDLAFEGPALAPRDPAGAAKTEQWISMVTTGFDPVFMRQYLIAYVFPGTPDGSPDRARIDAATPKVKELIALLDRELATRDYLAGGTFTLADMFLFPIVAYLKNPPESAAALAAAPHVMAWHDRVAARPSAIDTVPPPMPGRG